VQARMDVLRHPTSFTSDGNNLMRQPSAEDLDAAHQLVSSARGERSGSFTVVDGQASDLPDEQMPGASRGSGNGGDESREGPAGEASVETSSGLSQVCRYV
jgi:hypothetical protein